MAGKHVIVTTSFSGRVVHVFSCRMQDAGCITTSLVVVFYRPRYTLSSWRKLTPTPLEERRTSWTGWYHFAILGITKKVLAVCLNPGARARAHFFSRQPWRLLYDSQSMNMIKVGGCVALDWMAPFLGTMSCLIRPLVRKTLTEEIMDISIRFRLARPRMPNDSKCCL